MLYHQLMLYHRFKLLTLLRGRSNKPHYRSCPSVYLSVGPLQAHNLRAKRRRETKIRCECSSGVPILSAQTVNRYG